MGSGIGFDMPECEKDQHVARNILHRVGLHGNFALLNVSAETPATRWQEERFGLVAKYLSDEWNLPSLVAWSGYEQESRRAESAVLAAHGAAHKTPWTTLAERRSLSKLATIFIGADIAELHLAAAVGTHCVGLFKSDSALENVPFGQDHRAVYTLPEYDRKKRKRASILGGMDSIQPEMVCEMCDEVLTLISLPNTIQIQQQPEQRKAA
jgi:ADP-heptose:LPS heptosyltransferase